VQFNGDTLEFTANGLDITKTYTLKRSANLNDGFPTAVGDAFTPAADTQTVTDAAPSGDETFYRLEEVTE